MSLQHGLLGLLTYGDSTGYDLSKIFEDSLNYFWNAQVSQIYRELKRMEEWGWVACTSVIQDGKPNKKVYSITEDGTKEFQRWLKEFRVQPESSHHATIMRIFFGRETDPENTIALLKEYRQAALLDMNALQTIVKQKTRYYAETTPDGENRHLYWQMTIQLGIEQGKAIVQWIDDCIQQIEKGSNL